MTSANIATWTSQGRSVKKNIVLFLEMHSENNTSSALKAREKDVEGATAIK